MTVVTEESYIRTRQAITLDSTSLLRNGRLGTYFSHVSKILL